MYDVYIRLYVTRHVSEEVGVVECGFRRPISVSYTLRYVRLIDSASLGCTDGEGAGLEKGKKKDNG